MKNITVILGSLLAILPNIRYLADLQYRVDPARERSVCRNPLCSDELLLESANRFADGNQEDRALALANLQEALRRNAASPNRWGDVGEAFLAAGRIEEARYSFKRAVELGPQNPPAFWRAALFHSEIKEPERSHEHMGRMLELVPEYKNLVFETYLSSGSSVLETFEHGIPRQSGLAQEYFRYLLIHNAAQADIRKAWEWLHSHSLTDDHLAGDYTDFLLNKKEYPAALETWQRTAGRQDGNHLKSNLVFNGSFEWHPIQSGLDWRLPEIPGARISRDSSVAHSGSSSLQIEFDGRSNTDFNSVTQTVVAHPGLYHFRAWVRTSELTTDQGIGFRIVDSTGEINLRTLSLTGTHDWTPVDLNFTLSGPLRLLRIEVVRQPSWKFDNKIRGRIWIDGVRLGLS